MDEQIKAMQIPRDPGKSRLAALARAAMLLQEALGALGAATDSSPRPVQIMLGALVKATVLNKIDLTTRDVVGFLQHWGVSWINVGFEPNRTPQAVTVVILLNPTTGEVHQLPLQTEYTETTLEVVPV